MSPPSTACGSLPPGDGSPNGGLFDAIPMAVGLKKQRPLGTARRRRWARSHEFLPVLGRQTTRSNLLTPRTLTEPRTRRPDHQAPPRRRQIPAGDDLAGSGWLGDHQHRLPAPQVQRGSSEGQRAAENQQHSDDHQRELAMPSDTTRPPRLGPLACPVPVLAGRRRRRRLPQLPPDAVLIACDSVTVTAACAAGPACAPRFPPPVAPVAVQVTDQ